MVWLRYGLANKRENVPGMNRPQLSTWCPSDPKEKRRIVEVLAVYYRGDLIQGALIREINKPLRGMAVVPLYELRKVKDGQ